MTATSSERRVALGRLLLGILLLGLPLACGRKGAEIPPQETPSPRAESASGAASSEGPGIPASVHLTGAAIAEAGIQTWKVQPVDLEHLLVLTGTVGYDENRFLQVASNVKGRVASMPVDLGRRVRKDEPLLWIESIELTHAWDEFVKLHADLRVAQRAYERARALLEAKAISSGEFQAREASYLSRKVEAETAERTLRLYGEPEDEIAAVRTSLESDGASLPEGPHRLAVRSPFDGRLIDRKVTPGSLVESLQPLVTVADLSSVWVFLQAYEKDLALLQDGLSVTLRTEAYPQEAFRGRVDFLASVVDETTRTVRVRATLQNPREKLRPGMFVRAQVEVPKPSSEAAATLAVPQAALQTLEGRSTLFVEVEPGVFERRFIEVGHSFEGFTEILSGVKAGDLVVTEGSFVVKSEFAKASLVEEE
jgi:membrane fusion protein, heavy metal efflux system